MSLRYAPLLSLACATVLVAQRPRTQRLSGEGAIAALRRATVTVRAMTPDGAASGSGFILTAEGLIATAAHVIRDAGSATVQLQSGEMFDVQGVVLLDDKRDFALLRIAGFGLPAVALGNSDSVAVGRRLIAVGAPLGLDASVSDGLLSGVRLVEGTKVYQISIPVSPGSSGGPVATEDGRVVGMVVRGVEEDGVEAVNFALPINYVRGEIALAAHKVPVALARTASPRSTGEEPTPLTETKPIERSDSIAVIMPTVVNDSLGVDWLALNGVQVVTEVKSANGVPTTTVSTYVMGRTPSGTTTIENHVTSVWRQSSESWFGERPGGWYRDEMRTVVHVREPTGAEVFFQRGAVAARTEPKGFELKIASDTVVLDSAWKARVGRVPRGVLPLSALDMAIAALPDSLPRSFYVWVLDKNDWPAKPVWARVDFGEPRSVELPIARSSTGCPSDGRYQTHSLRLDVADATATVGAGAVSYVVLAKRPHVNVLNAKCVRIPELDQAK
jgi:S1-C subfamily serine protease